MLKKKCYFKNLTSCAMQYIVYTIVKKSPPLTKVKPVQFSIDILRHRSRTYYKMYCLVSFLIALSLGVWLGLFGCVVAIKILSYSVLTYFSKNAICDYFLFNKYSFLLLHILKKYFLSISKICEEQDTYNLSS